MVHFDSSQSQKDKSFIVEDVYEDDELTLQSPSSTDVGDVFHGSIDSLSSIDPRNDRRNQIQAKGNDQQPTRRLTLSMNEAQALAVTFPLNSQLQILAGPGTGKTKTLISRVIYILSLGVHPSNVIVTTFTVKAAAEMRDRIAAMVGNSVASRLVLGTFHSIARRFLVKYGRIVGMENGFQIADETDALHFIQGVMQLLNDETTKKDWRAVRNAISNFKSRGIMPEDAAKYGSKEVAAIYMLYQQRLKDANMIDFDDMLLKCVELLTLQPDVVANYEAILVDEFQDTNVVQYELMRLLAASKKNITIVGDPDQSIYAFRAAETRNMSRMRQDYPETNVVNLEENYRSSAHILSAAMAVIAQDKSRMNKSVLPNHAHGHRPVYFTVQNASIEAKLIAREIQRLITLSCGMLKPQDFAILVRSTQLTHPIETELTKSGIDYRMVGGFRFWEREEVKLLVNYLAVVNSRKSPALLEIINSPRRGIGSSTQALLLSHANAYEVPLWEAIKKAISGELKVTAKAKNSLIEFVGIIEDANLLWLGSKHDINNSAPLVPVLETIIERLNYSESLKKTHVDTWVARWENVMDLLDQLRDFCETPAEPELPDIETIQGATVEDDILSRFLAAVNLAPSETEADAVEPSSVVTISTIHGSKGLEFPIVFIPGVYNGSIPHRRAEAEELDEERRLLYVAMTRAKGLLYLSYPKILAGAAAFTRFSEDHSLKSDESPFLKDIWKSAFQTSLPKVTYDTFTTLGRILGREVPDFESFKIAEGDCQSAEGLTEEFRTDMATNGYCFNEQADENNAEEIGSNWKPGPKVRDDKSRFTYTSKVPHPTSEATTTAGLIEQSKRADNTITSDSRSKFASSFISGSAAMQTMAFQIDSQNFSTPVSVSNVNTPFRAPSLREQSHVVHIPACTTVEIETMKRSSVNSVFKSKVSATKVTTTKSITKEPLVAKGQKTMAKYFVSGGLSSQTKKHKQHHTASSVATSNAVQAQTVLVQNEKTRVSLSETLVNTAGGKMYVILSSSP
ncbi:P-loop containing nucleoside triphosphate hydrolase protein [Lipomyces arxii]|uniref:P-loop containing nucleoside triphosphate hydrolase protein n=1 Tax=Lipomyces arxii TaxID=56418 RepID=UPI0034CE9F05